jgi:glutamate/tyrosine decarboxylase-like PLP-dependent enzyme
MANPQLSTGHHGAFAVRAEQWLLRQVVEQLGLGWPEPDGQFTTGGEEANAMALQCALVRAFPAFARQGLRGLPGLPTVYASEEAHGSLVKAVRGAGLGEDALRLIPVDKTLQVKVPVLRARIAEDRKQGFCPVLLVATAGTTIAGSLDPLDEFRAIAQAHGLWFHVDAAWGGLLAMVPERAHHLQGWAAAHSVTFDPHKALAMPLGTGMFLTRERGALDDAFCVKTRYMPTGAPPEPYQRSRQWSRRFLGARLLLPLLAHGWEPFRRALAHQCVLGDELKARLAADQWEVANRTPLPVACFTAPRHAAWGSPKAYAPWARSLMQDVWIVPTRLPGGRPALRACITSHRTTLADVDHLVQRLNGLRSQGNDLREESTPLEKRKGPAEETGVRTT